MAAAILLALGSTAYASSFRAAPIIVTLGWKQKSAAIKVYNDDKLPLAMQVQLYRWTQKEGQDVYTPTDDLIASPPAFTVPAGGTQLVRVGARAGLLSGAYRLMIQEISSATPSAGHVTTLLRLNLPMYAYDPKAKADLEWTAWQDGAGEMFLQARNNGGNYAQILSLSAKSPEGKLIGRSTQARVILPDGSKLWDIGKSTSLTPGSTLRLDVTSGNGPAQTSQVHVGTG